jgi:hypothetical protein
MRQLKMEKTSLIVIGVGCAAFALFMIILNIICGVMATYAFENQYKSYWELSDRSSTLQAKEQYISQFVEAIQSNRDKFADYNAIFLKTPQNSLDKNLQAVITLRDRLKDIEQMNETSFEYQTAIQQITAQEQGEAQNMLGDIQGCYFLESYPLIWGWLLLINVFIIVICASISTMCFGKAYTHNISYPPYY